MTGHWVSAIIANTFHTSLTVHVHAYLDGNSKLALHSVSHVDDDQFETD